MTNRKDQSEGQKDIEGTPDPAPAAGPSPTLDGGGADTGAANVFPANPNTSVPVPFPGSTAEGTHANHPSNHGKDATLDEETLDRLRRCMQRTGISFKNLWLLRLALTHASSATNALDSNERLEFLGDSLLGLVASELLYERYPERLEGDLTRMKALMVSSKWCSRFCNELGLREFMQLGKGISHNSISDKVLGNLFEAFYGAVLADGGVMRARDLLRTLLTKFLPVIEAASNKDNPKSDLQQVAQRHFNASPVYELIQESGPDHQKTFQIRVRIHQMVFPPAWGTSKKEAEKKAAWNALNELLRQGIIDDSVFD